MKRPIRSYHALHPSRQKVWRAARLAVPARQRRFFEGSLKVPGQLWYAERRALYDTVRRSRPSLIFEVGTWKGGGSTLFIAQALHANDHGILHTVEEDRGLFESAVASYRMHLPGLLPYVRFHHGKSTDIFAPLVREAGTVDMLLLDGAEDSAQTMREYFLFRPHLSPRARLVIHDWESEKAKLVKKEILNGGEWQIDCQLSWPKSLGFAICSLRSQ